ncbi:MAG: hypothetical protein ACWGON_01965 [Gemmatimonadota bacterium]
MNLLRNKAVARRGVVIASRLVLALPDSAGAREEISFLPAGSGD